VNGERRIDKLVEKERFRASNNLGRDLITEPQLQVFTAV
jgi:hypothetical protein